jgi:orotate phosphoribosyltransferase
LNPHQLFRQPSTIWRLAQDLLDVLPAEVIERTEIVAGPSLGGALLAHTMAGLIDGRRPLTHPPCSFAPFTPVQKGAEKAFELRGFYARLMQGRRVVLADDVRNTGKTFQKCAELVRDEGGILLATVEIFDRLEAIVGPAVPNYSLVEYRAPDNYPASECPMCRVGQPVTVF